jgi:hypothetical protein
VVAHMVRGMANERSSADVVFGSAVLTKLNTVA